MSETAIIVPVDPAEAVVGRWRRRHTPSGSKGMQAHVTLLAPFTPPDVLVAGRVQEVREILVDFEPFDFVLTETAYFDLGVRRVLYLRPEPAGRFVDIIDALSRRFPEHPPYRDADLRPAPHLTIATSPDDVLLGQIEDALHGAADSGHGYRSVDRRVRRRGMSNSPPDGLGRLRRGPLRLPMRWALGLRP